MFKKAIIVLGVLIILVPGFLFLNSYLKVRSLTGINNPKLFIEQFDPTGKEAVEFEIVGLEGRTIISPLFPYKELTTQTIKETYPHVTYSQDTETDLTGEGRWMNLDPFWNVFWVEISPAGKAYERSKFYGPYRIE